MPLAGGSTTIHLINTYEVKDNPVFIAASHMFLLSFISHLFILKAGNSWYLA